MPSPERPENKSVTTQKPSGAPSPETPKNKPFTTQKPPEQCSDSGEDCRSTHCCKIPGRQCYQKNEWWAGCEEECIPGIDLNDPPAFRTPWTCTALGPRTPSAQSSPEHGRPAHIGWLFIFIALLTPLAAVLVWMKQPCQ